MDDLISRQAALNELRAWREACAESGHRESASDLKNVIRAFEELPSVQPERKTGKWLIRYFGDSGKCSVCGMYCGEYDLEDSDRYCRCCGAKMDGLKRVRSEEER